MTHQSVLYQEIIHALNPRRGGRYIDCTVGAGGHALGILEASAPDGLLLGLELDPDALEMACEHLAVFGDRVFLRHASYDTLAKQVAALKWQSIDGVLLDLGVSSIQLESSTKGFSFRTDGPLDMRFDPRGSLCAADLVNQLPERELADILFHFGEERRSRQVAHAIIQARPITRTRQLATVVANATTSGRRGMHPATRTFQALRIAVNQELDNLEKVLTQAVGCLALHGRLVVISFHSLEDRLVKQFFRQESQNCICPPRQIQCTCGHKARIRLINRNPIRPTPAEIARNPRSRSARMRVAEKL